MFNAGRTNPEAVLTRSGSPLGRGLEKTDDERTDAIPKRQVCTSNVARSLLGE